MESKFKGWLKQSHIDISQGNGLVVRKRLLHLKKKGVPNEHVLAVANLCRRVGLYHFATNLLVRKLGDDRRKTSPEALCEYACSIAGLGNYIEANRLFDIVDDSFKWKYAIEYIDVLLRNWDSQTVVEFVEKRGDFELSSYKSILIKLNYTSALIGLKKWDDALLSIQQIEKKAIKNSYSLLLGNCLEMKGQIFFHQNKYQQALSLFQESVNILKDSKQITWLYSFKWETIAQLSIQGPEDKILSKIRHVKNKAINYLSWETLRDCDLYLSHFTDDNQLKSRVYFGTPHAAFRTRALELWQDSKVPDSKVLIHEGRTLECKIDLENDSIYYGGKNHDLERTAGALVHVLSDDIYRPSSLYKFFHFLYPEEYFDPATSRSRVYKSIKSLRHYLAENKLPLEVTSRKSYGYRLRASVLTEVSYPSVPKKSFDQSIDIDSLKEEFSKKDFANHFKTSHRSANRQINTLIEEGKIIRIGTGSGTSYKKVGS